MTEWVRCSDECVLPAKDADIQPLSVSARSEGAWVTGGRVVRNIAAGGHSAGHPFHIPGLEPTVEDRARLLASIRDGRPKHILAVTMVCRCSFESPFLDARPVQDFGLGPDGGRLIHPAARRIVWPPDVLAALLGQLAQGLSALHEGGVAHGDPALMNVLVSESAAGPAAVWVDLNSVLPATAESRAVDAAAFEMSCLWPALIDADRFSPSLYAELAEAARSERLLGAYADLLAADRSDHRAAPSRAALADALRAADPLAGDSLIAGTRRRIAAAMAPAYFLDQTRSDQNARFFMATLDAERTRHALIEEERTRLHHHRFQAEIDELRAWSKQLEESAAHHEQRADRLVAETEARVAEAQQQTIEAEQRIESTTAAVHNAEERAAAFRYEADEVRADLNAIYDSRAWRLVGRFRRLKSVFRPTRASRRREPEPIVPQPVAEAVPVVGRADRYPVTVSVIMPVYNKGRATLDAVDSALGQTLDSVEVVVWDDGSTDPETVAVLDELEHRADVHVFRAPNRGVIAARNSALSHARGEFLSCLDPDDAIAPTYYEKAVALLRADPGVAIAYPWQQTTGDKEETWKTQDLDPALIADVNHVPVCAVFRREVYLESAGFSEHMAAGYEDWEMWAHAAELGFRGRVIPEPLFLYHYSGSEETSRDASARERHLELASRIGTLHPLLAGDAAGVTARPPQPGWAGPMPVPRFPAGTGTGRPIVMTLPWFTVGGADRVVESLVRHWTAHGRTVVALTTVPLGDGMVDRAGELARLTPFVYHLPSYLPSERWREFLAGVLEALPPATIVNIGSAWLQEHAAEIRAGAPEVRIVDQQFNDIGHLDGNRAAAAAIDVTVTAYEALADTVRADGRPRESVVTAYVGIDPLQPAAAGEADAFRREHGLGTDPVVGYVGRLSEEKRPEWMTRLAARIDARVVIVGDGPLAKDLEISTGTVWVPHVPEIPVVFAAADVIALPSRVEGIPLVAMEALAAGTPVVATAVGGMPELAGTPGLTLVDPDNFDAFSAAVTATLEEPPESVVLPDGLTVAAMLAAWDEVIDP